MRYPKSPTTQAAVGLALAAVLFMMAALWPAAGTAVGSHDMRGLFYPWLTDLREAIFNARWLWWDGRLFAGYPFLANPQVALFYPLTWVAILPPVHLGVSWYYIIHLWLAGMGMYLLCRDLFGRAPLPLSLLPALTFMFSGFFAARIYAGHMGLLAVHSWVPWLLWGTLLSVRGGQTRTAVRAALPLGLAILAGHTTSLLYIALIWGGFALFLLAGGDGPVRWPAVVRPMAISAVVGVLLAAVQLLPLAQLSVVAGRTAEADFAFATGYSFPPTHLITLLVPEFFGEPTRAGYWSVPNFEELAAYAGVLPLLLAVVLVRQPSQRTWLAIGLIGVGILLALGSYGFLYKLFYTLLPPFRLARAPGRAMFLYVLGSSLLVGEWAARPPATAAWLKWVGAVIGVAGLSAIAATGAVFASVHPTDTSGRLWHQLGGWATAALFLGLATAALYNLATRPHNRAVPWLLLMLTVADLWLFGFKLVRPESMAPDTFWAEAQAIIGVDAAASQRVLPWGISIFAQNGAAQAGLNSVFGYNALEIGANTALAASVPDPRSTAYDILGAGYVVATAPQDLFTEGEAGLQLVGQNGGAWVYARPRVLPLVRLVYAAEVIPDPTAAIARVHQPDFSPAQTAILPAPPACTLSGTGAGTAEIISKAAGDWQIRTRTDQPALLVVSETAYPGWEVALDGQPSTWQIAYTAVRAVCVPAGEHTLTWHFRPTIFAWGGLLSTAALLLVALSGWPMRKVS